MANVHISELFPAASAHSSRPDTPSTSPSFFACTEHNTVYRWNGTVWQDWLVVTGGEGLTDHGELDGLADDDHTQYHNDTRGDARYYTQAQVTTALSGKSDTGHDHDGDYAALVHDHDDDYYTEAEVDTLLDGKVNDTGNETIAGVKTFSSAPLVPDNSWAIADTSGLQAALDGKSSTSHNHDAEYSAITHDHDADYAALVHNHDADYADIAHDHDADYAALAHNHAASDINSGTLGVARLPEAVALVADKIKNGGTVPARPTADTDVPVLWVADEDPDDTQAPENGDFWLEY